MSGALRKAIQDDLCTHPECVLFDPNNPIECDDCVDGRFIGAVCEYASTCDGCGDLTHHELMVMDEKTQLGYCEKCVKKGVVKLKGKQ